LFDGRDIIRSFCRIDIHHTSRRLIRAALIPTLSNTEPSAESIRKVPY
jgi:hypothetical protein